MRPADLSPVPGGWRNDGEYEYVVISPTGKWYWAYPSKNLYWDTINSRRIAAAFPYMPESPIDSVYYADNKEYSPTDYVRGRRIAVEFHKARGIAVHFICEMNR